MPIEALKRSHTVTSFDPLTLLPVLAVDTDPSRADRHGVDDLRAALSDRAPFRLARPYQRRPRRLERRDHLQPRRRAELRPRGAHGARRALCPRARIRRRRHRPLGFLGRRRVRARRRERRLFRSGKASCAQPQGPLSAGARPAEHRASGAGLARHRAGRRLGSGSPTRRRDRRGRVRRGRSPAGRASLLRRREGPNGGAGARIATI